MSQFWVFTAISDILTMLVDAHAQNPKLAEPFYRQVNIDKCRQSLLSLLQEKPDLCFQPLFLPQLCRIHVMLMKVDHIEPQNIVWRSSICDAMTLITAQQDQQKSVQYFRYLIKLLLTMDEECVERAEQKKYLDLQISNNVKDDLRESTVANLVPLLSGVLKSFQSFEPKLIRQTLRVLA